MFGCNSIYLVIQGTESSIESLSLHIIADLTTQLGYDVTLSIDLVLQFTLLQLTELVNYHSVLTIDGIQDRVRVTLVLCRQSIGLLTHGKLIGSFGLCGLQRSGCMIHSHSVLQGICLVCYGKTILAAALTELS